MSSILPALRRLPGTSYSSCLCLEFLCPKCIWPDSDHLAFLYLEPQIWKTTGNPCHGDWSWRGLAPLSVHSLQSIPPLVPCTLLKADKDFLESVKNLLIVKAKLDWLNSSIIFIRRPQQRKMINILFDFFALLLLPHVFSPSASLMK